MSLSCYVIDFSVKIFWSPLQTGPPSKRFGWEQGIIKGTERFRFRIVHTDFVTVKKTNLAPGERQREEARTLMSCVHTIPGNFLVFVQETLSVQALQASVSTLNANWLLSLQPHPPELYGTAGVAPTPRLCTHGTSMWLHPQRMKWCCGQTQLWEMTASRQPSETKGSNE